MPAKPMPAAGDDVEAAPAGGGPAAGRTRVMRGDDRCLKADDPRLDPSMLTNREGRGSSTRSGGIRPGGLSGRP